VIEFDINKLRLSLLLSLSTVRIVARFPNRKPIVGTGFFYLCSTEYGDVECLVTCRHVVADASDASFVFHRWPTGAPNDGEQLPVNLSSLGKAWVPHPNEELDLVAFPMPPLSAILRDIHGVAYKALAFGPGNAPDAEASKSIVAGDEVVMVGYPTGLWDEANGMPIFRRGSLATHLAFDYQKAPAFVVDIQALPGSSGSPIVLFSEEWFDQPGAAMNALPHLKLLGVLGEDHLFRDTGIVTSPTGDPSGLATSMELHAGLGIATKAAELRHFAIPVAEFLRPMLASFKLK
jgi:hypothetical protein